ncbi:MAG: SGNH/GDSL hydrolase family protein [Planctomycetes bacterium]|nr:SGNH/GDSL hydrolase family protein [Planctomycetota bacterium]
MAVPAKPHIVLLGDSILDNRAYVGDGPDVVCQLRTLLGANWKATLLARDGSVVSDVRRQLEGVPADAGCLVLSAGGNDAIGHVGILDHPARSPGPLFDAVAGVSELFSGDYTRLLDAALALGLPTAVCTIYHPQAENLQRRRELLAALTIFNDAILTAAFRARVPVIDLRLCCTEPTDFVNHIEPSVHGGEKIAKAIAACVRRHDFASGRSAIYGPA